MMTPTKIPPFTTYPWRIQLAEEPVPFPPFPQRRISVCRIGQRRGMAALEWMISDGLEVGPVLVCPVHHLLHVLIAPREDCPMLHRVQAPPACAEPAYGSGLRHGRIWMIPQEAGSGTLTDFPGFFDRLHRRTPDTVRAAS